MRQPPEKWFYSILLDDGHAWHLYIPLNSFARHYPRKHLAVRAARALTHRLDPDHWRVWVYREGSRSGVGSPSFYAFDSYEYLDALDAAAARKRRHARQLAARAAALRGIG